MNDYEQARLKYMSDPIFHAIVEMMYAGIAKMDYSPTELRQAAMFAAIKFEQENVRHSMIVGNDPLEL